VATELIKQGITPQKDGDRFDSVRWSRQLMLEAALPPSPWPAFLDRGLFDTIAYRRAYNQPILPYMLDTELPRYRMVIVLDPLPWTDDGVRYEGADPEFQARIRPLLYEAYEERGVPVVEIPVASRKTRLNMIFDALAYSRADYPHCQSARPNMPLLMAS
jgi:predicted ATPase